MQTAMALFVLLIHFVLYPLLPRAIHKQFSGAYYPNRLINFLEGLLSSSPIRTVKRVLCPGIAKSALEPPMLETSLV